MVCVRVCVCVARVMKSVARVMKSVEEFFECVNLLGLVMVQKGAFVYV